MAISVTKFQLVQERLGWGNTELARRLGVHPNSIVNWRNGSRVPEPVMRCMELWAEVKGMHDRVFNG